MTPVLIDTDPGIDDALALLLAWGSPEIRVEAVTTVAGNVGLEAATTNTFRLLALRRPDPAPVVAAGAAGPLRRPLRTAQHYHGVDGLGDLGDWPAVQASAGTVPAARLIAETARRHGPRLTLLALGPLTNVALALEADAAALRHVGRVVAMGGAVDVAGNVTPDAEFNFHVDPDAARAVLEAGLRLDLVPLDATRQATLEQAALEARAGRAPGELAQRVRRFTAPAFRRDGGLMPLHDPLAVAVAIDETLVEWEPVRLTVGVEGELRRAPGPPTCRIARRVDRERFLTRFLERLWPPAS